MIKWIAIAGLLAGGCGEKQASGPVPQPLQPSIAQAPVAKAAAPLMKVDAHDVVLGKARATSVAIDGKRDIVMTVAVEGVAQVAGKPYGKPVGDHPTVLLMSVAGDGDHAVRWVEELPMTVVVFDAPRLAVDGADNIVVAGTGNLKPAGGTDLVLAKFTAGGAPVWSHHFAGAGARALAVDDKDHIVLGGVFAHAVDLGGGKKLAGAPADDLDLFVARFSPDGEVVYANALTGGGSETSDLHDLAIDAHGDAVVLGDVAAKLDGAGVHLVVDKDRSGGFLAAFAPDGKLAWSMLYPGFDKTAPERLAIGVGGALVVCGSDADTSLGDPELTAQTGQTYVTMTGFVDSLGADHKQATRLTLGDLGIGTAENLAIGANGEVVLVAGAWKGIGETKRSFGHVLYVRVSAAGRPDGAIELPGAKPSGFGYPIAARGADLAIPAETERGLTLFTPAT